MAWLQEAFESFLERAFVHAIHNGEVLYDIQDAEMCALRAAYSLKRRNIVTKAQVLQLAEHQDQLSAALEEAFSEAAVKYAKEELIRRSGGDVGTLENEIKINSAGNEARQAEEDAKRYVDAALLAEALAAQADTVFNRAMVEEAVRMAAATEATAHAAADAAEAAADAAEAAAKAATRAAAKTAEAAKMREAADHVKTQLRAAAITATATSNKHPTAEAQSKVWSRVISIQAIKPLARTKGEFGLCMISVLHMWVNTLPLGGRSSLHGKQGLILLSSPLRSALIPYKYHIS
jgi:hypothetical protein